MFLFLREFIKNWRQIGSVIPSSRFLVARMLKPIDFTKAKLIVEFGPGLGTVTQSVLGRMRKDAMLIVFELNDTFSVRLKRLNDPRLVVMQASAGKADEILQGMRVDAVISCLPLAMFTRNERFRILKAATTILKPAGVFIQFQYSLALRRTLESAFSAVSVDFEFLNAPPAFVYLCSNKPA